MGKKKGFALAFICWMGLITWASLATFKGHGGFMGIEVPHLDKIIHFIFYFVAIILCLLALREQFPGKWPTNGTLWTCAIILAVFGIIIEVLQSRITVTRQGDLMDALANTSGVFVGLLLTRRRIFKEKDAK
ncbi:MAG: VanZ family protein [Flavobacteriaceae bacterium]